MTFLRMPFSLSFGFILFFSNSIIFIVSSAWAANCETSPQTKPIETAEATAAMFANARKASDSLRAVSERMINKALSAPLPETCPENCGASKSPTIILKTIPKKFLSSYSDAAVCEGLLKQTTSTPFSYSDRKFKTVEELNAWFGDFSQGNGKDGKDLYEKCPGSCSPQYTTNIKKNADGSYLVDATVICGPARDKDDNMYKLSTELSWSCAAK